MKSIVGLTLTGIALFIVFVIAKLPAAQVIHRVDLPSGISVEGVAGTIWNGSARTVNYKGLPISDVKWQLSFLPLLWGSVSLDVDAGNDRRADQISFAGEIQTGMTGDAKFSSDDFLLYLPTPQVLANVRLPIPVDPGGRFRVTIFELAFDKTCQTLQGNGEWLNASVMGTQGRIPLGVFKADLNCDAGAILATVEEPNSLGLSLTARVADMRRISADGKFKVSADLPDEVHQAAAFFGQPDANGYTEFRL